ncbi:hypothetical protein [Methanospirillum hungatei]|uniref:hypothetical protein n=1 Tax=Methanospirillum hungatei TaxID=2203 RepID=UPI0026ED12C0|nr:hypothetical protein [Methanospirillum hungatei]MCA1915941.1 hypothetical protein [Methanospirillum hungatei]
MQSLIDFLPASSNLSSNNAITHPRMRLMLPDQSVIEVSVEGRTIETILNSQGIDPLTTLISREDEIIPEDTIPDEEDVIRVIRISHGG